jgi:hypothetical protein
MTSKMADNLKRIEDNLKQKQKTEDQNQPKSTSLAATPL